MNESAQKSDVLNQDFAFNHLSKRKRASPAHVSFNRQLLFNSGVSFLPCSLSLNSKNQRKLHKDSQIPTKDSFCF